MGTDNHETPCPEKAFFVAPVCINLNSAESAIYIRLIEGKRRVEAEGEQMVDTRPSLVLQLAMGLAG